MDVLPGGFRVKIPQGVRLINPGRGWPASITPAWLLSRTEIDPTAKLLYGRLCGYCGEKNYCWPSLQKLAVDLGLSRSATEKAMRRLKDCGLVMTQSRQALNSSSVYFFPEHPWMQEGAVPKWDQGPEEGSEGGHGPASGGDVGGDVVPIREVNPTVHTAQPSSPVAGEQQQAADFPSPSVAVDASSPPETSTAPHVVNDVSLTYAPKPSGTKQRKPKQKPSVTHQRPRSTPRTEQRDPHVADDVSLTSSTTYGMISGKEIMEGDQTSLTRKNRNGEPGGGGGAAVVLALYDQAYSQVHGCHYGPSKRDYAAAAWAWAEATQVALLEAKEKGLGSDQVPVLRERVLVHWCGGLASLEGYAAQKRWQFWLVETLRAELGTPFRITRKAAPVAAALELDGPLTPPEELPMMWAKVMHAFKTGEVPVSG